MEKNPFVDQVAAKIQALGLTTLAILLLEAHKPLAFIGSQLLLIAQPTIDLFIPSQFTQNSIDLLADADQLEYLLARLEAIPPTKEPSL
ncbi:MAG: hypothetical protein KDF65_07735 [Anaerolineae bacterium]|nr:hypothetical protein [Anaerolineae bacterium]